MLKGQKKGEGWQSGHLCKGCGKRPSSRPLSACPNGHITEYARHLKRNLRMVERARQKVLTAYGNKCSCCGFDNFLAKIRGRTALEIDHINGRPTGRFDSKERGYGLYLKLIREHFPPGYRILCISCNAGIEYGAERCFQHV